MKKNFLKKALCIALTAISLTSVATTAQPMQVQAAKTYESLDKHGKISGVAYDAQFKYNGNKSQLHLYLRNTNKYPVHVVGSATIYGKNGKKLKTKNFDDYLYASQRKNTGIGENTTENISKYKITYKVKKVSLKTINEKLEDELWGVNWACSEAKSQTALYNIKLKDGHNDLGKKHYSDDSEKDYQYKSVYIKDFDYDKSTGRFVFTAHYAKKVVYLNTLSGFGSPGINGNIGVIINYYDKNGFWIGSDSFGEYLTSETHVKGDTVKIYGTVEAKDLYGVDSLDDIATIDLAFISTMISIDKSDK